MLIINLQFLFAIYWSADNSSFSFILQLVNIRWHSDQLWYAIASTYYVVNIFKEIMKNYFPADLQQLKITVLHFHSRDKFWKNWTSLFHRLMNDVVKPLSLAISIQPHMKFHKVRQNLHVIKTFYYNAIFQNNKFTFKKSIITVTYHIQGITFNQVCFLYIVDNIVFKNYLRVIGLFTMFSTDANSLTLEKDKSISEYLNSFRS